MAATMKDVARRAGVSIYTVSKYINGGTLKEKNRKAVEDAIAELGYRPNAIAQSLRTAYSRTVGILVPTLDSYYFLSLITHIQNTLEPYGYTALVCDCGNDPALEEEKLDFLLQRTVDGVIVAPMTEQAPHITRAQRRNLPVVALDRAPANMACDAVLTDDREVIAAATQYLIELGHKRIAFVGSEEKQYTARERYEGYKAAMEKASLTISDDCIRLSPGTVEDGFRAMADLWLLTDRPSAIIAAGSDLTTGLYWAATKRRIFVPDELSIIGYDDRKVSQMVRPSLCTIARPTQRMGEIAAKLLLRRISGDQNGYPRISTSPSEIVAAESVGRCLVSTSTGRIGRFTR